MRKSHHQNADQDGPEYAPNPQPIVRVGVSHVLVILPFRLSVQLRRIAAAGGLVDGFGLGVTRDRL